jgi:hypothetical protein
MEIKILGKDMQRSQSKKVRIHLGPNDIVNDFQDWLGQTLPDSVQDNMYTQLCGIEIDVWIDTETGNVVVDGAWN